MPAWDKLVSKIKNLDKDLRFEQLKKILEYYGYKDCQPNSGSSHHIFRKANRSSITIPKSTTIKTVYIKLVKDIVEQEEKNNEK